MRNNGGSGIYTPLLWVIILLLIIIIVYFWYIGDGKNKESTEKPETKTETEPFESNKIEAALRLLNENKKLVVQALIDHGGEMLQKDISYELDITRVQTHRILQSLINREIVTTEYHYNTKEITLANWLIQ